MEFSSSRYRLYPRFRLKKESSLKRRRRAKAKKVERKKAERRKSDAAFKNCNYNVVFNALWQCVYSFINNICITPVKRVISVAALRVLHNWNWKSLCTHCTCVLTVYLQCTPHAPFCYSWECFVFVAGCCESLVVCATLLLCLFIYVIYIAYCGCLKSLCACVYFCIQIILLFYLLQGLTNTGMYMYIALS